ncbi:MAG: ComF family protein [Candidatus Competibacteraceae bacterium]
MQPRPYDRTFAPLLYKFPVDSLIKSLKFGHQFGRQLAIARLLGEWLGAALQQRQSEPPQGIIPVPLHPSRLRERGFNQSLELARPVARCLEVPLLLSQVRRTRRTQPQARLDAAARRSNVRDAFSIHRPIQFGHVAILDDVITTGSTVAEIAGILRKAGVKEIEVWAVARTTQ